MPDEYIKRKDVLECIKESRDGIDWGQSEDGDAFLHYSACLYRTIASNECFPSADVAEVVRCKDCSHAHKTSFPSDLRICLTTGCFHSENHFCSDGKRMDGGT